MLTRRIVLKRGAQMGLAAATAPLWSTSRALKAFAQAPLADYKAVVVITLDGGNDGNNTVVPLDTAQYDQYASLRGGLALSEGSLLPVYSSAGSPSYGLHPALVNISQLYNSKRALVVANVGPLAQPATKEQLLQNPALLPASLLNHVAGFQQWESAQTGPIPTTGWGGRVGDFIANQSGSLPPVLNGGPASIFTCGNTVQGVSVQTGTAWPTLLPGMNEVIEQIAIADSASSNEMVAAVAKYRVDVMKQQILIDQAIQYGALKTPFSESTGFGGALRTIAQIINGRSVIGANRQIFYLKQGAYDTHQNQLDSQQSSLSEFDTAIGNFMSSLDEMGLTDQVLICTHSDFSRTLTSNTSGGSDHAWANNQLMIGGGIDGGRIVGTMPDLELGGSCDLNGLGCWIPTLSVTQMTAAIGAWMGLNSSQVATVFPDLANFPSGAIRL
jgi:uncharacterized protein (DUF1501 family)